MTPEETARAAHETLQQAEQELEHSTHVLARAKLPCPHCLKWQSKVVNSRSGPAGDGVWRRRQCLSCGKRFTTAEMIVRGSYATSGKKKSHQPEV